MTKFEMLYNLQFVSNPRSNDTVVWPIRNLKQDLDTKCCEGCGSYFTGPAPIQRGPGGRTVLVCGACKAAPMMNATITPLTRAEQAEALADLYDVPLADIYRRYGAVLLSPASPPATIRIQLSAEVVRGQ